MRVIAATFQDETSAEDVLRQLRDAYELRCSDAELAPLGAIGSDEPASVLLAGRFYDDRVPNIRALVEDNGGRVVVEVDEAVTKKRVTPVPARAQESRSGPWGHGAPDRARAYP